MWVSVGCIRGILSPVRITNAETDRTYERSLQTTPRMSPSRVTSLPSRARHLRPTSDNSRHIVPYKRSFGEQCPWRPCVISTTLEYIFLDTHAGTHTAFSRLGYACQISHGAQLINIQFGPSRAAKRGMPGRLLHVPWTLVRSGAATE